MHDGDARRGTALLVSLARQNPSDHEIWLELSRTSRARGRDDAVGYARRASELAPNDTEVLRELTLALAQDVAQLDEAQWTIQKAIELEEANPLNWTILGVVRLAAGNSAGARLACKRALSADPLCIDAHLMLADIAFASGDWNEAESRFRLVLNLAPETVEAADSLAWLAHHSSQNGDDRELIDRVGAIFADAEVPAADQRGEVGGDHRTPDGRSVVSEDAAAVDPEDARPAAPHRDDTTRDVPTPDASDAPSIDEDAPAEPSPPEPEEEPEEDDDAHASNGGLVPRPSEGRHLADDDVMAEEVLDVVHRHIEAYNQRDLEALLEGFAEDAVLRAAGDVVVGRHNLKELFANAFSDAENTVLHLNDVVVQNGVAACEMTESTQRYSGMQRTDLVGIYVVRGRKITHVRLYYDA